ncbi:MAG: flagellar hook-length control protein FliK [Burkholderiales bacterium]
MQVTPPSPQSAAPAQSSAPKPADAAKAPFAHLLRQSQSAQQAAPAEPARPDPEPAATTEPEAAAPAETPAKPGSTPKTRTKLLDKSSSPRATGQRGKAEAGTQTKTETPAVDAEANRVKRAEAPAAEPSLAPWLLALQHPTDTPLATGSAKSGPQPALAEPTEGPSSGEAAKAALSGAKADDDTKARLDPAAATPSNAAAWAAATSADSAAVQRAAEHGRDEMRVARPILADAASNTAALGAAAFNPLAGSARESTAPLAVNLPTPLASADFAQALGVQMSVLATDGVQHAELHLNPAEMGPVSVQIVIDGTRAQVDFGADLAATRQAIEAGLPQLAGALSDAGFTLTGGGVSQHAGGRSGSQESARGDGNGSGTRRGVDASALEAGVPRLRRTVAAGGIDLYA